MRGSFHRHLTQLLVPFEARTAGDVPRGALQLCLVHLGAFRLGLALLCGNTSGEVPGGRGSGAWGPGDCRVKRRVLSCFVMFGLSLVVIRLLGYPLLTRNHMFYSYIINRFDILWYLIHGLWFAPSISDASFPRKEIMNYVRLTANEAARLSHDCNAVLCPLLDTGNHDPNVTIHVGLRSDKNGFQLALARDSGVNKGQEYFINYGNWEVWNISFMLIYVHI